MVRKQAASNEFRKALKGRELLSRHLTLKHRTCDLHPLYSSPIDHTGFVVWAAFHTWTCRNLESEDSLNRRQLWGRGWACLWVFLFVSTLASFFSSSLLTVLFLLYDLPHPPLSSFLSLLPPSLNLALVFPPPLFAELYCFPLFITFNTESFTCLSVVFYKLPPLLSPAPN